MYDTNATATGSSASVSEGVYFIRGYFVNVPTSTVADQYTNSPSYKIGLSIKEEIVSASKANPIYLIMQLVLQMNLLLVLIDLRYQQH